MFFFALTQPIFCCDFSSSTEKIACLVYSIHRPYSERLRQSLAINCLDCRTCSEITDNFCQPNLFDPWEWLIAAKLTGKLNTSNQSASVNHSASLAGEIGQRNSQPPLECHDSWRR
jgi:hypothetical protein